MDKLENKSLIDAINQMKENNTKENQSLMLGEMMKAKFLNPTTLNINPNGEGKITIPKGTQLSFYTISTVDNKKYAMAFTDTEEMNKWAEKTFQDKPEGEKKGKNSFVMEFMDYAGIVLDKNSGLDGLVINPFNENIVFNKEQVASLRDQRINKEQFGMTRNVIKSNEEIGLRKLNSDEYPTDMVYKFIEHMKNKAEIKSAWICAMKKQEKQSFLLTVDFEGDLNNVLGELGRIAKPLLNNYQIKSLDMVPLSTNLGGTAINHSDKIYDKNGLQIFTKTKNIEKSGVVENAIRFVNEFFANNCGDHDVYHTLRVYSLADKIAQEEDADLEIVRLSALLHDVDDRKIVGVQKVPFENAKNFLNKNNVSEEKIQKICNIISKISFKGDDTQVPDSLEGKIVQDADRLDAIGAIGIARCFYYNSANKIPLYNPENKYKEHMNEEEYYSNDSTAINHFYEKLLKLKDLMNTETARKIAAKRHDYLKGYLDEFLEEWEGNK